MPLNSYSKLVAAHLISPAFQWLTVRQSFRDFCISEELTWPENYRTWNGRIFPTYHIKGSNPQNLWISKLHEQLNLNISHIFKTLIKSIINSCSVSTQMWQGMVRNYTLSFSPNYLRNSGDIDRTSYSRSNSTNTAESIPDRVNVLIEQINTFIRQILLQDIHVTSVHSYSILNSESG